MLSARRLLAAISLGFAMEANALSPLKFDSEYTLHFEHHGVALSESERARFGEHLQLMASRGQCGVEGIRIDGDGGNWGAKDLRGRPASGRGAYLIDFLRRHNLYGIYFLPPAEASTPKASSEVRLMFSGYVRGQGCSVRQM